MPSIRRIFVENILCSPKGLTPLCAISGALGEAGDGDIMELDFGLTESIDANLACALGAILSRAGVRGVRARFVNMAPELRGVFERNGFMTGRSRPGDTAALPYRLFDLNDGKGFAGYVNVHMQGHGIPEMSANLRLRFLQGLSELFNNCGLHSKSSVGVFACGQAYPERHCLDFTIADAGRGIRANVASFLGFDIPAHAAIDWAMTEGNTTRQGDIPGGLGLKIVREFITLNKGGLFILSDRGFWELTEKGINIQLLPQRFQGTMVNLRINTADEMKYVLTTEQDPNSAL